MSQVTPSVVTIEVSGSLFSDQGNSDPLLGPFVGEQSPGAEVTLQYEAVGSGVIIDAERGLVLTNDHVVAGAGTISVALADGSRHTGRLLGGDKTTDLAVLQLVDAAAGLRALPFGNSDALQAGDYVLAIGSPFGLTRSISFGVVSGTHRSNLGLEDVEDFIQTDAFTGLGSSGGALVDLDGKLIGINTAILGSEGASSGIGFAIPINLAKGVVAQLLADGHVERGDLGIIAQTLTANVAEALGVAAEGVVVTDVLPGSAAERAGIAVGEVITAVNGTPVSVSSPINSLTQLLPVGSSVSLSVTSHSRTRLVSAVLQPRSDPKPPLQGAGPKLAGLALTTVHGPSVVKAQVDGALVASIADGSPAQLGGLQVGDLIVAIDGRAIARPEDVLDFAQSPDRHLLLLVIRGGQAMFLTLD